MRFTCPHCREHAISGLSKFMSTEAAPAVCLRCGKYSCEPMWRNYISGIYWGLGIWVTAGVAVYVKSWWPFTGPLAAWLIFESYFFIYSPLRPISDITAKRVRWEFYVFLLALIACVTIAGISHP